MFKLHSKFEPTGSQSEAIKSLINGIENGKKHQMAYYYLKIILEYGKIE